jgi:hypothetical protein
MPSGGSSPSPPARDAACAPARLFRIEWPVQDCDGHDVWSDFVIEGADGQILEVVECREHLSAVPLDSVEQFLRTVARIRAGTAVTEQTRFRFVSPVSFLADGRNLADGSTRAEVIGKLDSSLSDVARAVVWDFHRHTKTALTNAACTAMMDSIANAKEMCRSLYARLAAQLSDRWPAGSDACRDGFRDVLIDLFPGDPQRHTRELKVPPEDAFDVIDLKRRLNAVPPLTRLASDVRQALSTPLYPDDQVTTRDVFIELNGRYEWIEGAGREKVQRLISVTDALLDWLTDIHDTRALAEPLVVVGPFGAGKTTALKAFAARLLDAQTHPVVPIFIQLRDLARTSHPGKIDRRIEEYAAERGFDISHGSPSGVICLICDGFDELNLYYDAEAGWAGRVYRQLRGLAARQNMAVVVSSRPLQLLDQVAEVSKRGDTTRRISIEEMTPEQVEEWCKRYRQQAGLSEEFSLQFLEERKLSAIARTPIILYMIARLYATTPELLPARAYTLGEIYQRFVDWTVDGAYAADKKKHHVPSNYRDVLQEIAWHLSQAKGGMLQKSKLLQSLRATYGMMIEDVPVDVNLLVAHMLQPAADSGDEPDSLIEFTHQSFRDYLVAERVLRVLGVGGADAIRNVAGHAVTPATLGFLFDALDKLPNDDRRRFLMQTHDADDVEMVLAKLMPVTPGQAATVAGLVMLLRIRAAAGLRDDEQKAGLKDVAYGVRGATLRRLVDVLRAFPNDADAEAMHTLFMRHLDGLAFAPSAAVLDGVSLTLPSLAAASWRNVHAWRTELTIEKTADCAFVGIDFSRAVIVIEKADSIAFRDCNFASALLRLDCFRTQMVGCDFQGAVFHHLHAEDSSFLRNSWDQARITGLLIRCTVDEKALARFRQQNLHMADCHLPRASGKWRHNEVWESLFDPFVDAIDLDEFFSAAERLLRIVLPECRTAFVRNSADSRALVNLENHITAEVFRKGAPLDSPYIRGQRYVAIVHREDLQTAQNVLISMVTNREVIEGNVWTPGDLVDEAFYAVADRVRTALRAAPSLQFIPENVSYRRSDLRLLRGEQGVAVSYHTPPADIRADLLDEFDRDQRARITIITIAEGGKSRALIERLVDVSPDQWTLLEGSEIPAGATDITFLLSRLADTGDREDSTYRSILHAVVTNLASDPGVGFIIDGAHEAADPIAVVRLFRDTRSSLVLTMPDTAYEALREAIRNELAGWPAEAGLAQPLLLLEVL